MCIINTNSAVGIYLCVWCDIVVRYMMLCCRCGLVGQSSTSFVRCSSSLCLSIPIQLRLVQTVHITFFTVAVASLGDILRSLALVNKQRWTLLPSGYPQTASPLRWKLCRFLQLLEIYWNLKTLLKIPEISLNLYGPLGNFCVKCWCISTALVSSHETGYQIAYLRNWSPFFIFATASCFAYHVFCSVE